MAKSTGMVVDGVAASQTPDSSGEILDIRGCDISDFESGMAVINYEHADSERPGASVNDIVGKIIFAKKIFAAEDCDTERQTMFWDKIKVPFIYFVGRLADGAGHPGAIAAAAFIRDQAANEEKHILRWSVEGTTIKKEGQNLVRSIARCLALTRKPCNRSCDTGVILDPNAPKDWDKNPEGAPPLAEIMPAETKKFEHPNSMKLGSEQVVYYDIATQKALEGIAVVRKALEAGSYNAAPSTLSGGAALQVEDPSLKRAYLLAQAKAAVRDWDKSEPFKQFLKHRMPEASEEFLDRFSGLVDDYHAKRGLLSKAEGSSWPTEFGADVHGSRPTLEDYASGASDGRVEDPNPGDKIRYHYDPHFPLALLGDHTDYLNNDRDAAWDEGHNPSRDPYAGFSEWLKAPHRDPIIVQQMNHRPGYGYPFGTADGAHRVGFAQEAGVTHAPAVVAIHYSATGEPRPLMHGAKYQPKEVYTDEHYKAGKIPGMEKMEKKAAEKLGDADEGEGGDIHFDPDELEVARPRNYSRADRKEPRTVINPKEFAARFPKLKGPKPTPKNKSQSYFDEKAGILHTNKGSFPMQIPKGREYMAILNGPEVQPHHDEAMRHWTNLHNLLEQGKLPVTVAMHAALFSGMSPASSVPMQEIAFSHLQDRIKAGMDPSVKGGVGKEDRKAWMKGNLPGTAHLPEYMNEYWKGPAGDPTRLKETGEQKGVLYPANKWNSVAAYHKLHPELVKLLQEHGSDARTIATKLLELKSQAHKYDMRAKRQEKKLDQRQPLWNETTGRGDVEGFKPKTLRYLLGMLGGGNAHVADTHFVRHAFGLPQDDQVGEMVRKELGRDLTPEEVSFTPNQHIKDVLWSSPNAAQIGEGIDRYYQKHHPAVKYAQNRFFGGRDDPQAIFPGFWAHWLSIAPHERLQGIYNNAKNQQSDHRVYWNAVNQILKHHDLPSTEIRKGEEIPSALYKDAPLAVRTAAAHRAFLKAFGPEPAMWFYMKHLLPQLLAYKHESPPKTLEQALHKMEYLAIELNKAAAGMKVGSAVQAKIDKLQQDKHPDPHLPGLGDFSSGARKPVEKPRKILHQGQWIMPGEAVDKEGRKFHLLHADPDGYVAVMRGADGNDLRLKLLRRHQNVHFKVRSEPKVLNNTYIVDSERHGSFLTMPEQHALIHGMEINKKAKAPKAFKGGVNESSSKWQKNSEGKLVYVKGHGGYRYVAEDFPKDARLEGLFHHMANHFFGLGKFVPTVATFRDPASSDEKTNPDEYAAIEGLKKASHTDHYSRSQQNVLMRHGKNGDLEKLAVMDRVMGNRDRHEYNYMFTPQDKDAGLKLIDHGLILNEYTRTPNYLNRYLNIEGIRNKPQRLHPSTISWLKGLDEKELNRHFKEQGIPDRYITKSEAALRAFKKIAAKHALNESEAFKDITQGNYRNAPSDPTEEE